MKNSADDLTKSHLKTIRTCLVVKNGYDEKETGQRPDSAEAVRVNNGLQRETGDENQRMHPSKQERQRANEPFT